MALGQLAVAKDRVTGQLGLLLKSGVELGWTGATPHPPTSESRRAWYHPAGIFVSLFIYLWPHQAMCGILVPQPGIKPGSPALGFSGSSAGKESICNAGGPGSIPGSGRSPGEGIGYPFCREAGKESTCNAGDLGSIPGLGRSPGEGNSYPLQYSGLENSMDCIVRRVAKNWTRLSNFHFSFPCIRRTEPQPLDHQGHPPSCCFHRLLPSAVPAENFFSIFWYPLGIIEPCYLFLDCLFRYWMDSA